MAVVLSYEDFRSSTALAEVRSLPVWGLYLLPLPCVLHFLDSRGAPVVWTTDRDYSAMNKGALTPRQYSPTASAQIETVGEYERRKGLKLVLVQVVKKEETDV